MIQFSKPRRALDKSLDQFRRHEVSAKEALTSQSAECKQPPILDSKHALIFLWHFNSRSPLRNAQPV